VLTHRPETGLIGAGVEGAVSAAVAALNEWNLAVVARTDP